MERPTDSYKETHNMILATQDSYFGGQVSNLQVAELMAFMAKNRRLAFCKVVEVIAETTAPLTPMEELLAKIPPQRELPAEPKPDSISLKIQSEPTSLAAEKEIGDVRAPKANPQSPFTMYADLKPPTSPSPPAPSTGPTIYEQKVEDLVQTKLEPNKSYAETESAKASGQNAEHLSPYMAYEDLKPPASPAPAPSTASKSLDNGPAAKASSVLGSSTGSDDYSTTDDKCSSVEHHIKQSRPLSPYTMYEDLKPPSSPVPSVPRN